MKSFFGTDLVWDGGVKWGMVKWGGGGCLGLGGLLLIFLGQLGSLRLDDLLG